MGEVEWFAILCERTHPVSPVPFLLLPRELKRGKSTMKLIPWQEIWTTLSEAKEHGNLGIIDVFLRSVRERAVFDDHGAWCCMEREGLFFLPF